MKATKHQENIGSAFGVLRPSLSGHLQIARVDHWFKNIFVFPGIVAALGIDPTSAPSGILLHIISGLVAVCLVASSNYVINEVMDAPFDQRHHIKCRRPVPSGRVSIRLAYIQWLVLMIAGVTLGLMISTPFALTLLVFWIMGCVYNIPPLRSKDVPYLDVLSEAINNPLRMLAGWFIVGTATVPPASLLISYWMIGCYFMAMKRFAEYRDINDHARAAAYRRSFAFYTEQSLLVSVMFYSSAAMLFFGAFIMRYRLELILSFPLVALVMATYLALAYREDSAVQRPEGLYREPTLMVPIIACAVVMLLLLFIDVPIMHRFFSPAIPISEGARLLHFGGAP
jgi:decaprenyl-phosphate phosphoribosyltransferase